MAIDNNPEEQEESIVAEESKPAIVGIGASAGGLAALKQFFETYRRTPASRS